MLPARPEISRSLRLRTTAEEYVLEADGHDGALRLQRSEPTPDRRGSRMPQTARGANKAPPEMRARPASTKNPATDANPLFHSTYI